MSFSMWLLMKRYFQSILYIFSIFTNQAPSTKASDISLGNGEIQEEKQFDIAGWGFLM